MTNQPHLDAEIRKIVNGLLGHDDGVEFGDGYHDDCKEENMTDQTPPNTTPLNEEDRLGDFKREARDALWDYFGIADKNDLAYFENIAEVLYPLVTKTIVKELESFIGHSNEIPEHVLRSRIAELEAEPNNTTTRSGE